MVIQRWQTVFLLLAAIFIVIFCFIPVGNIDGRAVVVSSHPIYLALNIVAALTFFIAIFMYGNTRRQRRVAIIGMLLVVASMVMGICYICGSAAPETHCSYGAVCLLLPAALIEAIVAYRRILADERLLRSYDRLR